MLSCAQIARLLSVQSRSRDHSPCCSLTGHQPLDARRAVQRQHQTARADMVACGPELSPLRWPCNAVRMFRAQHFLVCDQSMCALRLLPAGGQWSVALIKLDVCTLAAAVRCRFMVPVRW
jgi:hypothetical protein